MRRTLALTTFAAICVALFLSIWSVAQETEDTGDTVLEVVQKTVVVEQTVVVKQAVIEVDSIEAEVDALAREIMKARFDVLDPYAKKNGWTLDAAPVEAATDPEVLAWWTEWVGLKMEFDPPPPPPPAPVVETP